MDVRIATADDRLRWDAFVDATASVPVMACSAWGRVLERAYGVPVERWIAEDGPGAIVGTCMTYVSGSGTRYSLRHGFVAADDAVASALIAAIRAAMPRVVACRVTSGFRAFEVGIPAIERASVVMPIAATEEQTWVALRNKTRNMIRRAERERVAVRNGTPRDLDAFYGIYGRRMLAKGVPVHSRAFFVALLTELSGAELLVAEREGTIISGMFLCTGPRCAAYPFQATAPGADRFAPTQLLIWEAMRRCVARGISLLDMGESTVGGNVYASKCHFGGEPRAVYYYAIVGDRAASARSFVASAVTRASRMGMRVLPFVVGARLGVYVKQRERIL